MTSEDHDTLIDDTIDDCAEPAAHTNTSGPAVAGASRMAATAEARRKRGLTIRLKLTIWTGLFFLLAGALLIGINYFMMHDSMTLAPGKVRALIAERHGLNEADLEPPTVSSARPDRPPEFLIIDPSGGISARWFDEALRELRDEALHQLWTKSLIALGIIAVLTFGLAWIVAGRMLRPVHKITSAARKLSGSTLHERIGLTGPRDELKELADTFDQMLERLDTAFTAQKEFVANASHELRTPLTIIRTEMDVAMSDSELTPDQLQEMGAAITQAVDRSEDLIDGLLTLANAERMPTLTDLDLAEVTMAEVDLASAEADALGLRLELDLQSAPVKGEKSLLQRMAGNLVENAVRHNKPDGWFSVKTFLRDGQAVLEVANSGSVVAPEDAERLFERFYRPDKSRSRKTGGFGLGLSIVKSVVAALNGSIELEAPESGGLKVTVSLPAGTAPGQGSGS
jgi:signal transduction histidine kinase